MNTNWATPLPQDANVIANLIHSLREGTSIFFCYDNQTGHQSDWILIECITSGDYIEYLMTRGPHSSGKQELDEAEINELAKEISTDGGYRYYAVQAIEGYKKSPSHYEDDQAIGDYEKFGPDKPTWADVQENKSDIQKLEELVRHISRRVMKEFMSMQNKAQLTPQPADPTSAIASDPTSPPVDAMSPALQNKMKQEKEKIRRDTVKNKEAELKTAKTKMDAQSKETMQIKKFTKPQLEKDIQKLKGAKI